MSENDNQEIKDRLLRELTDAPQGVNDSDMPMPGNPNPTGEVGPSPTANSIPESFAALDGEFGPDETGEEDPNDAEGTPADPQKLTGA